MIVYLCDGNEMTLLDKTVVPSMQYVIRIHTLHNVAVIFCELA